MADRLISAEELHNALKKQQRWIVKRDGFTNGGYSYDQVHFAIDNAPTVDAEPVRHGHWFKTYDDEGEAWMCSECCEEWGFEEGHPKDVYGCNYCPNCGAKMDGERREDDKG